MLLGVLPELLPPSCKVQSSNCKGPEVTEIQPSVQNSHLPGETPPAQNTNYRHTAMHRTPPPTRHHGQALGPQTPPEARSGQDAPHSPKAMEAYRGEMTYTQAAWLHSLNSFWASTPAPVRISRGRKMSSFWWLGPWSNCRRR